MTADCHWAVLRFLLPLGCFRGVVIVVVVVAGEILWRKVLLVVLNGRRQLAASELVHGDKRQLAAFVRRGRRLLAGLHRLLLSISSVGTSVPVGLLAILAEIDAACC